MFYLMFRAGVSKCDILILHHTRAYIVWRVTKNDTKKQLMAALVVQSGRVVQQHTMGGIISSRHPPPEISLFYCVLWENGHHIDNIRTYWQYPIWRTTTTTWDFYWQQGLSRAILQYGDDVHDTTRRHLTTDVTLAGSLARKWLLARVANWNHTEIHTNTYSLFHHSDHIFKVPPHRMWPPGSDAIKS